ncbi:hypothetical protein HNE_0369 [Hyphomonas neptunium ATCC 15444]|uniref:Uncharacterized protein n=2 Tax=Hyphomonas TaxID=85 RepID=Q0C594_HYPNA|nr:MULTISPECIES: hypothetical protein [Hyphomonas]ABI77507.1 hypothetical protein HNE_0369 [Hyphomonas neptunium ATCC 15444]KCZ95532.1 hypothetical protein HHI_05230 [Hyphomonas hirschiana VP5]
MALTWTTPINSLIRFAQMMAERLAMGLAERLGIGRFGYTVFLPREEHAKLDAEINYIECLTRRALFLIAATFGALPPLDPPASPAPPAATGAMPPSSPALPGARRPLRFRLTETARARTRETRLHEQPAEADGATSPREAPTPRTATLLPAAQLVRRYQALETVFENPWPHIERMRRLIWEKPGRLLPSSPQADAPGAHIPRINRRILRLLQGQVERAAQRLETG